MASSLLLLRRAARLTSSPSLQAARRCLAVQSYGPITDDLRDRYTPLHPTLQPREVDNNGLGKKDRPVETKIMRPNLEFADADAGPAGPKVYHLATGEKPVVIGAAHLAKPPDSWTAAKNLESEFDKFLPFRRAVAIASGRGPSQSGPLAIAAE